MQYITIDIDIDRYWFLVPNVMSDTEFIERTVRKISRCRYITAMKVRYSQSYNGRHIILWCNPPRDCVMCRMAFDDQQRLDYDTMYRKPWQANVLFDAKKNITLKELFTKIVVPSQDLEDEVLRSSKRRSSKKAGVECNAKGNSEA